MFLQTGVMTVTTATRSRRNSMSDNAMDNENISKPAPEAEQPKREYSNSTAAMPLSFQRM